VKTIHTATFAMMFCAIMCSQAWTWSTPPRSAPDADPLHVAFSAGSAPDLSNGRTSIKNITAGLKDDAGTEALPALLEPLEEPYGVPEAAALPAQAAAQPPLDALPPLPEAAQPRIPDPTALPVPLERLPEAPARPLDARPPLSLREALDLALKENPRMLASQSRELGAGYNVDSARGALLPHAQITAGLNKITNPNNHNETDNDYVNQIGKVYSLQISQNIFDGLVRFSTLSRAKLLSTRATQEKRKTELDTIEAVQREFFKLIRTRSDIKTFRSSVARLKSQKEAADAFYRLEMAPRLTVLQVDTALAQMEQRLSKAVSDEQVQLVKLNALLGQHGPELLDFTGDLMAYPYELKLDFDECLNKAQTGLPEVVIAKTDAQIAPEELTLTRGKMLPRVDASAAYIKQNTDYKKASAVDLDRKYYTMGLNLSWEFFSSGEQYYEQKARQKLLQAAQEELANIMLSVRSIVRESYLTTQEAKNQIRIAQLRTTEAGEAYEQASMRFRSGIGTSFEVLDAHEKVTAAEAAYNQAQADYLTAVASLFRGMGEKEMNLSMLAGVAAAGR